MTVLKQYNTSTSTWDTVVVGQPGEPGIVTASSAPADTSVLWMDTADTASQVAIPSGGTAGQILAKTSGTDYATGWVDNTDNRNHIINGGMDVWQRGTSFSLSGGNVYTADRAQCGWNGTGATVAITRQPVTPGELVGDASYFYQFNQSVLASGQSYTSLYWQKIENVRTLAGQTVTVSAWIKSTITTANAFNFQIYQDFGGGGSALVGAGNISFTASNSWTRASASITLPSIAGKTIGTDNSLWIVIGSSASVQTTGIWGVQLEAGSVATPFKRNAPSIQAELAACQRYYYRTGGDNLYQYMGTGSAGSSTSSLIIIQHPVKMRVKPTSVEYSTVGLRPYVGFTIWPVTGMGFNGDTHGSDASAITMNVSSGLNAGTRYDVLGNNSASSFIGLSAEL